jgi:hypothetical protein
MIDTVMEAHKPTIPAIAPKKSVFVSHIAEEKPLAVLFKKWIEQYFLGSCEAFLFESSFPAGTDWLPSLHTALEEADVVVPLCSPSSMRRPWVIFEIGAGWMKNRQAFIPVLHSGMTPGSLPVGLRGMTAMDACETGFAEKFILQLSAKLELRPSSNSTEVDVPEEIQSALGEIQRRQQRYDLFLSAPMSSFGFFDKLHWSSFRKDVADLAQAFERKCGFRRVYPEHADHMPSVAVGIHQSLTALQRADRFVLVFPERLASGCLAEAGYALALDIPSIYFVHNEEHLPAFLTNRDNRHVRIERFDRISQIGEMVAEQGLRLFDGLE